MQRPQQQKRTKLPKPNYFWWLGGHNQNTTLFPLVLKCNPDGYITSSVSFHITISKPEKAAFVSNALFFACLLEEKVKTKEKDPSFYPNLRFHFFLQLWFLLLWASVVPFPFQLHRLKSEKWVLVGLWSTCQIWWVTPINTRRRNSFKPWSWKSEWTVMAVNLRSRMPSLHSVVCYV